MPRGRTRDKQIFVEFFLSKLYRQPAHIWVCGVPFFSFFGLSSVQDNVTGTAPPTSPNRLQYVYIGICTHLQHDAGPDRRKCVILCRNIGYVGQWWEMWNPFSRHGMSWSRVLATISTSCPLTVLYIEYGSTGGYTEW